LIPYEVLLEGWLGGGLIGTTTGIDGLRVINPVGPKNLLNQLKVSMMMVEVAFKSEITIATVTDASSKAGIQMAVKLSNSTYELFVEFTVPEVELLATAASPMNIWKAL
jgi:hypothetical protein